MHVAACKSNVGRRHRRLEIIFPGKGSGIGGDDEDVNGLSR